jgi:heme/copper-type cytochrome/quinol oxidase subunit 3
MPRYSCAVPEEDKDETADALVRTIEQELAAKRLEWERDRGKQRSVRLLAFSFLSLVIFGGLLALFFVLSRANEIREQQPKPSPTPLPLPIGLLKPGGTSSVLFQARTARFA